MNRQQILQNFRVDSDGIIRSPGKFQGEMLYAPYFHVAMLQGDGDDTWSEDGETLLSTSFQVEPADRQEFPELEGIARIELAYDDNGFCYVRSEDSK